MNLPLNVLELGLELLLRLNALHEHHIVVSVHLDKLVVHGGQGYVLILLACIRGHIFLNEFHFGGGDARLDHGVTGRHQRT